MQHSFTIRVYGILIRNGNLVLSHEVYGDRRMIKFPGGGLEFGEGTVDCLKREWMEEYGLTIQVKDHFYTTDFFVASAYHTQTQVMSIYYLVETDEETLPLLTTFTQPESEQYIFTLPLHEVEPDLLTFPIDKHVLGLLKNR